MEKQETTTKTEEKPTESAVKEEHPPKPSGLKSKLPLIIIALLLIILIPLGGYFLVNEASKAEVTPIPTEAPTDTNDNLSPTKSPTPTSTSIKLDKSFTSAKFADLSFEGYKLMHPSSWTLKEERDGSVPISTVTLSKEGYTLKIFQAATGGAGCIYEGEMPEGPASDYRTNKFVDLTSFATLRQTESPSNGKMSYAYCQKNTSDGSFGQPTSVGHMSVTTGVANPDPDILAEIEKIVEAIQIVK